MSDAGLVREFPAGPFRETATAWLHATEHPEAVEPSPASTVLLVRGRPLEVFMIERAAQMEFAPSTWVFPGGRVDPADGMLPLPESVAEHVRREAQRVAEPAAAMQAWFVAAIRELFEEAGVLLASSGSRPEAVLSTDPVWAERRRALEAHEIGLSEALDGCEPALESLCVVDRWVTPEFERRRYDTMFFLALLPDGARAEAVTREAQRGRWVRPQEMLDAAEDGTARLLPPTRTRLTSLLQDADAAAAFDRAGGASRLRTTRPWPVLGVEGPVLRAEVNP